MEISDKATSSSEFTLGDKAKLCQAWKSGGVSKNEFANRIKKGYIWTYLPPTKKIVVYESRLWPFCAKHVRPTCFYVFV